MKFIGAFALMFLLQLSSVATDVDFEELKLVFVNGKTTTDHLVFDLDDTVSLLEHPDYDEDRKTVLYGFGYTEKYTSESTQMIVSAFIERNDYNIIVVDWSNYSGGNYIMDAIPNAFKVGEVVGRKLIDMNNEGFQIDMFHLIGHSLGGQLMGFTGRSVIANSGGTLQIQRITALDPAGPIFYPSNMIMRPLSYTDGAFVDIHTDSNFFGAPFKTGDADFWPNSGRNQPNCPTPNLDIRSDKNFCSHRRSWVYFAESLKSSNPKIFNSIECNSWNDFVDHKCNGTTKSNFPAYMGIGANPNLKGNFYLQTNPNSPFNRNQDGTFYTKLV